MNSKIIYVEDKDQDIESDIGVGKYFYRILQGFMKLKVPDQTGELLWPKSILFVAQIEGTVELISFVSGPNIRKESIESFHVFSFEILEKENEEEGFDIRERLKCATLCDEATARVLFPQLKKYKYKYEEKES